MAQLNELSMEMLSISSSNSSKMMGGGIDHHTLGHHSHSSTNMSKSISGASLSSSQATHRTQCSSGLSSVSARFVNLSSSPNSPAADGTSTAGACRGDASTAAASAAAEASAAAGSPRATAPVAGGGKTVLAGVAPSCFGKLRRRARFSGWKEAVYFELRSTALLTFTDGNRLGTSSSSSSSSSSSGGGSGSSSRSSGGTTGNGSSSSSSGLASLAAKIMNPRNSAQAGVDWSWSIDLRGAERVVELPGLTKREKDCFAFAVELHAREKKKTLVLAARSAAERENWMLAMDKARRCVHPEEFEPLSVIGEGHFGKVLLVRWNKSAEASAGGPSSSSSSLLRSRSSSSISITATGGGCSRHTRQSSSASVGVLGFPSTATIAEGYEEGSGKDSSSGNGISSSSDPATDGINAVTATATTTNRNNLTGRYGNRDRFLAVKEVALHKGTSLPGVLNERQILGVLREHPFVVTLRCAWRRGNFLYYGLDFLPGADLFELFRRNSIKMDLQAARVYGGQIALALEHLHEHGICYRDLKPENILVDAKGHLCLADMGLSKILGTGEHAVRTSTVCGTRAYLAPEMVLRKPYGMSVDFWQFGCFVYELYAGHSPFWKPRSGPPGRSHDQTVALILAGEIHYSRSIGPVAKSLIRDLLDPDVSSRLGCRPSSSFSSTPETAATTLSSPPPPPCPEAVETVVDSDTAQTQMQMQAKETEAKVSVVSAQDSSKATVPRTAAPSTASSSRSSRSGSNTNSYRKTGGEEAGTVGGWQSVKQHAFFKDMDWEALLRGEIAAPIKPAGAGRGLVGNFAREYTRQRAGWGGDQQELRDVADKDGLFKRELLGFDFVRD